MHRTVLRFDGAQTFSDVIERFIEQIQVCRHAGDGSLRGFQARGQDRRYH